MKDKTRFGGFFCIGLFAIRALKTLQNPNERFIK